MTYMNYAANRYYSMKTKGDSRRANELIPALLRSCSKQMTYTNYTANGDYSMKPKEIGAATGQRICDFWSFFPARVFHNLTHLGSKGGPFFLQGGTRRSGKV